MGELAAGFKGLSPRTRGSLHHLVRALVADGPIPAHAGKPPLPPRRGCGARVYPRPWGGAWVVAVANWPQWGLIPAHAGEPFGPQGCPHILRVHPRPCGGALGIVRNKDGGTGLSPPMRGSSNGRVVPSVHPGSIPAHAGEPTSNQVGSSFVRVYPRPCGGARLTVAMETRVPGLSPPMRGSPEARRDQDPQLGSIPAHAGEPSKSSRIPSRTWVYPRPCGGAVILLRHGQPSGGLSPPMRGSRHGVGHDRLGVGSIPAHAGEPPSKLTMDD